MPGPGAYSEETHAFGTDGKKITFGSKVTEKYNEYPGPGAYDGDSNIIKSNNSAAKIGTSTRTHIISKDVAELPGPGNYSTDAHAFGKDGQKITMGSKIIEGDHDNFPGPGHYNEDYSITKAHNVSVKMGTSTRTQIVS